MLEGLTTELKKDKFTENTEGKSIRNGFFSMLEIKLATNALIFTKAK